jgi:hypothetical protein
VESHPGPAPASALTQAARSLVQIRGAARSLADKIANNPKQAVEPWLNLLDVYRGAGMRAEWEALARRLHRSFNIEQLSWDGDDRSPSPNALDGYSHIIERLTASWGSAEALDYLNRLITDNRNGTRTGFPLSVLGEILLLIAILESRAPLPGEAPASAPAPTEAQPIRQAVA